MDSKKFFDLSWTDAAEKMDGMNHGELMALVAFAHGFIEQSNKRMK